MRNIKVAIFEARVVPEAEARLNQWLEENPDCEVVDIRVTSTRHDQVAIMIIYHPDPGKRSQLGFRSDQ